MVWSVINNVRQGLKYRGGWKGLFEHMYTNGDYPFKMGTFMGADAAGNRYYENRVDYVFGQHRWVEPGDIHNFDSSSIAPEWHGWMTSMTDEPPSQEDAYIAKKVEAIAPLCDSDAPSNHNVGHQEKVFNFHGMHNQSQIRSRGYGIGNPIVGLPADAPDAYYTQPGSPYNEASRPKAPMVGDLGNNRPYKSDMWAKRLRTPEETQTLEREKELSAALQLEEAQKSKAKLMAARRARGAGTIVG